MTLSQTKARKILSKLKKVRFKNNLWKSDFLLILLKPAVCGGRKILQLKLFSSLHPKFITPILEIFENSEGRVKIARRRNFQKQTKIVKAFILEISKF